MKHHVAVKFIAVLLCAVSLLGIVGSAAGMLVLTELDLYNKTVEQVREERIQGDGENYAHSVARNHADLVLGGCPEAMVADFGGYSWFPYEYNGEKYGYALMDAEGNVLETCNVPLADATVYTYPVTGQYIHLVSLETETEKQARELEKTAEYYQNTTTANEIKLYDAIPQHGTTVSHVVFYEADGTVIYTATDPDGLGFVYYSQEGSVTYRGFYGEELGLEMPYPISGVLFLDSNETLVYEAANPNGVGYLQYNEYGNLVFESSEAETAEQQDVYRAVFYGNDNAVSCLLEGGAPVGIFYYNAGGYAVFETRLNDSAAESVIVEGTMQPGIVYGITLYDANGERLYDIHSSSGIGALFYGDNQEFVYNSIYPELAMAMETDEEAEAAPEQSDSATEPAVTEAPAETEAPVTTAPAEATEATEESTAAEETVPPTTEAEMEETKKSGETKKKSSASSLPENSEKKTQEAADTAEPQLINGKPLEEYDQHIYNYYDPELGETVYATYVYLPMPEYTVELYLASGALNYEWEYDALRILRQYRSYLLPALGICLIVFAIFAVYLCCAAGHKPKSEEIRAGGLNCLPLDLYACLAAGGIVLMIGLAGWLIEELVQKNIMTCAGIGGLAGLGACLLLVGFSFAFVAQVKTPDGYWWRNTLFMRCLMLCVSFGLWLEKFLGNKFFPWLGSVLKALWNLGITLALWLYRTCEKLILWMGQILGRAFRWMGAAVHRFLTLLPMTWQWVIGGCVLMFISALFLTSYNGSTVILGLLLCLAIILYGAHCFGVLFESTKRMGKGDLDTKVEDKLMVGCFKDFAGDLNNLADVAVVAAQKQLKSERMKTELITNVSHDIKTPLTSIINYVDLLQKPHTDEEQEQYLEVLDRQSQRLKKLIDDLMDMSKANTGNMAVDITKVDAVESVTQALGEFADKLDRVNLVPVFRHTEESVAMMADGKLVWRVLSNLLNNAVKYAMPGTRLYIDLIQLESKVVISLKNISRDELNIDAEELMERFVRGDDSRNTEGSGLGLNIAKSLMELQKGQLQLLVDGDLFKVTLIFPGA